MAIDIQFFADLFLHQIGLWWVDYSQYFPWSDCRGIPGLARQHNHCAAAFYLPDGG